ncbi:MAG: M28 family peptidase, partial [Bacteroidales bacterium]|nr:M28 family peptidase [Bacteroidales bacterium]
MGMIPFYSSTFTQSFPVNNLSTSEKITGRNIIGVIPSLYYTDEYILISVHYDHLGIIGGRVYNGADDNASGVSALLSIA